jgi:large subunit ribosomal protein L4
MLTATNYSKTGVKHEATVKLDKAVFGVEANHQLVSQAYRTYLANGRTAHASTLKRGEVAGGGKKPWKQKGTGRARVGSIRVPNWKGGGVVFGPTGDENYTLNLPIKMKRAAIRMALSLQAAAGNVLVIESLDLSEGKTKAAAELMAKMQLEGTVLLVVNEKTDPIRRATNNLAGLNVVTAKYLNVYNVMNSDKLVITADALETVNSWLGDK